MSNRKWGVTRPRFQLMLCAVGIHHFYLSSSGRESGRHTLRECYDCGLIQTRKVRYGDAYSGWSR